MFKLFCLDKHALFLHDNAGGHLICSEAVGCCAQRLLS
jgi:hypothetical protein